jgi:hypothetical protein
MPWQNFQSVNVPQKTPSMSRPRFSLTSDIVGFRRCERQYGYFGNDGFTPAHTVQIFYGTIIHQVLDRCHRHFSGLAGFPQGTMPTDVDIENYFTEVESALRAHGVRAINAIVRERALFNLKAFNRIEGPVLYPRVVETEYRLESDRQQYVMRGVVDVLADNSTANPEDREIWDYKGTNRPNATDQSLQDYVLQMCVYAELFRVRTGSYPARAILYFINELFTYPSDPPLQTRPPRAVYEVTFTPQMIQQALTAFDLTAQDIIQCKSQQAWSAPASPPDEKTCDVCDIRWNCQARAGKYPLRFPIL